MSIDKLILGTAQLGMDYGISNINGKISFEDSLNILKNAKKYDIKYLDTAEAYGNAHEIIGEFHKQNSDKFKIITKFPKNFDITELNNKIINYLDILNINKIDIIMFHDFDNYIKNKKEINKIKSLKEKYISKIGISIYTNEQFKVAIEDDNIDVIQIPFNLFDNINKRGEYMKYAKEKRKIIHARSVFLQGLFFMNRDSTNKIVQSLKKELLIIDNICRNYNVTIEELCFNYNLQQPLIDNVLFGVDNTNQLNSNIKSIKKFDENIYKEIDKIKIINNELLNPSLWS